MQSRNIKWRSVVLKIKEISGKCLVFLVATCTGNDKGPITGGRDLMVCALCTGEEDENKLGL